METVPTFVRDLVLDAREHELIATCGVRLGERVEIDLEAVQAVDDGLATRMSSYFTECSRFWERYGTGEPAGDAVLTRRVLTRAAQSDRDGGRSELNDEIALLAELPVVGELVDELLGADPDIDAISRKGLRLGLSLKRDNQKNMLKVAVRLAARTTWPAALGGAHSPGEFHRVLELRISHARWRDRRGRRLVEMTVWAEEIWPDPAPFN